jgi:hypothetical protein
MIYENRRRQDVEAPLARKARSAARRAKASESVFVNHQEKKCCFAGADFFASFLCRIKEMKAGDIKGRAKAPLFLTRVKKWIAP